VNRHDTWFAKILSRNRRLGEKQEEGTKISRGGKESVRG